VEGEWYQLIKYDEKYETRRKDMREKMNEKGKKKLEKSEKHNIYKEEKR
jgi:hypothetical protein